MIVGYSLDDVLLMPNENRVHSRLDTDLRTRVSEHHTLPSPLMATNMSTITEAPMMKAMYEAGGVGVLHRFMSVDDGVKIIFGLPEELTPKIASVGVGCEERARAKAYMGLGLDAILIDIAHAHNPLVYEQLEHIKSLGEIDVMVGNIATYEASKQLLSLGANAIRAGIGGGSRCTTRTVTGHGIPNLTALVDVVSARNEHHDRTGRYVPIIIDGGIKSSGDIVKSLAFGADVACLGGLLAGTRETPGTVVQEGTHRFKKFYGASSKNGNLERYGTLREGIAAEGFSELVPYRGSVHEVIEELQGGIRSGLTYSGAKNIEELRQRAQAILLTVAARYESKL